MVIMLVFTMRNLIEIMNQVMRIIKALHINQLVLLIVMIMERMFLFQELMFLRIDVRPGSNPSVMWNTFLNKWVMVYAGWALKQFILRSVKME